MSLHVGVEGGTVLRTEDGPGGKGSVGVPSGGAKRWSEEASLW